MNYLFLSMSMLLILTCTPIVVSGGQVEKINRSPSANQKSDTNFSTRLKERRAGIGTSFKNQKVAAQSTVVYQSPEQEDYAKKFMINWAKYLARHHPDYDKYLPARKLSVAKNYAKYEDYELERELLYDRLFTIDNKIADIEELVRSLKEEQLGIHSKIQEIESKMYSLNNANKEIRWVENKKGAEKISID